MKRGVKAVGIQLKWPPEERPWDTSPRVFYLLQTAANELLFSHPQTRARVASGWTRSQSVSFLPRGSLSFVPAEPNVTACCPQPAELVLLNSPAGGPKSSSLCRPPPASLFVSSLCVLFQTHLVVRTNACSVVMEIGWLLFFI